MRATRLSVANYNTTLSSDSLEKRYRQFEFTPLRQAVFDFRAVSGEVSKGPLFSPGPLGICLVLVPKMQFSQSMNGFLCREAYCLVVVEAPLKKSRCLTEAL
jgi:hypothetical protein